MLNWPALSPVNASNRLLRSIRRSSRLVAALSISSRFEACFARPEGVADAEALFAALAAPAMAEAT